MVPNNSRRNQDQRPSLLYHLVQRALPSSIPVPSGRSSNLNTMQQREEVRVQTSPDLESETQPQISVDPEITQPKVLYEEESIASDEVVERTSDPITRVTILQRSNYFVAQK